MKWVWNNYSVIYYSFSFTSNDEFRRIEKIKGISNKIIAVLSLIKIENVNTVVELWSKGWCYIRFVIEAFFLVE